MPRRHSEGAQETAGRRADVLSVLKRAAEPLPIAEIADQLGVHPNTVRFHLDTLVHNRQVERVASVRRAPGRPPQLFQAVVGMDPTGPRHYRVLAEVLAESLADDPDSRERALRAGRRWGLHIDDASGNPPVEAPVARLIAMLAELGFAPETLGDDVEPAQIGLRNCPYLELAVTRPHVTCPIHLGIMQGVMQAWGSPVTVDRLEAFVEPDLCVAYLAPAAQQ